MKHVLQTCHRHERQRMSRIIDYVIMFFAYPVFAAGGAWWVFVAWACIIFGAGFTLGRLL